MYWGKKGHCFTNRWMRFELTVISQEKALVVVDSTMKISIQSAVTCKHVDKADSILQILKKKDRK